MSVSYPFIIGPSSLCTRYGGTSTPSISTSPFSLSAANSTYSMVFALNKSGIITDVGFWVIVSGTASQYLFALTQIDAAGGTPVNTNYGGSSGTVLEANQLVNAAWNWVSLSSPATGTVGDIVAARVMRQNSSTSDYIMVSSVLTHDSNLPRRHSSGGLTGQHPVIAIKYNDGTVQGMPLSDLQTVTFNMDSDPDERGMKFSVPVDMTCNGATLVSNFGANDSFRVLLYNDTEVVRAVAISDEDQIAVTTGNQFQVHWPSYDLIANNTYRLTLQSDGAADDISVYELSLVTGSYGYVFPGGIYWEETYRTNSGSFTDRPNDRLWMGLLINTISPSTGTVSSTTIITGEGTHAWAY